MPLRKDSKRRSDVTDSDSKTADTVSNTADCQQEINKYEEEEEEEDDETQDAWLESLGVENSEIKKINHSQVCTNIAHSQFVLISRFILGANDFRERKRSRQFETISCVRKRCGDAGVV